IDSTKKSQVNFLKMERWENNYGIYSITKFHGNGIRCFFGDYRGNFYFYDGAIVLLRGSWIRRCRCRDCQAIDSTKKSQVNKRKGLPMRLFFNLRRENQNVSRSILWVSRSGEIVCVNLSSVSIYQKG